MRDPINVQCHKMSDGINTVGILNRLAYRYRCDCCEVCESLCGILLLETGLGWGILYLREEGEIALCLNVRQQCYQED